MGNMNHHNINLSISAYIWNELMNKKQVLSGHVSLPVLLEPCEAWNHLFVWACEVNDESSKPVIWGCKLDFLYY